VSEQVSVADLLRRIRSATAFMRPANPQRRLLEECHEALVQISVQLAEAKGTLPMQQATPPTMDRRDLTIERYEEPVDA